MARLQLDNLDVQCSKVAGPPLEALRAAAGPLVPYGCCRLVRMAGASDKAPWKMLIFVDFLLACEDTSGDLCTGSRLYWASSRLGAGAGEQDIWYCPVLSMIFLWLAAVLWPTNGVLEAGALAYKSGEAI